MSYDNVLRQAGHELKDPEKDNFFLTGTYKAKFTEVALAESDFGNTIKGSFKAIETLSGKKHFSSFPEFVKYFKIDPKNINNKNKGFSLLLRGLFAVGVDVDKNTDDEKQLVENLLPAIGTEVFIEGKVGPRVLPDVEDENGKMKFKSGADEQKWIFLSKKDAEKSVKKDKKSEAKAEATPF